MGRLPAWALVALAAALLAAGAGMGWRVAGWRYAAQQAATERAWQAALAGVAAEAARQRGVDEAANARLAADRAALRERATRLAEDITNAKQLSDTGACTRNPFGPDFVRLWNDSAEGRDSTPEGGAERGARAVPGEVARPAEQLF